MNRLKWLGAVAVVAMISGTPSLAQEQPDLSKMAKKMRQNQEELRRYSWDTKMTFLVNDELRRSDTYTVRYVMGGMVEKMQIDSEVAEGKVRGPDGKKLSKKELEAARVFVTDVKDQLDGYLNPLFAEKAVATSEVQKGDGTLLLLSRDVMTTGDTVEITLSEFTHKPIAATVKTSVEASPVALEVTFGSIEYGPNHPMRSITTSQWQGFKLSIITENSNYQSDGI
jgi:hypothetical protein